MLPLVLLFPLYTYICVYDCAKSKTTATLIFCKHLVLFYLNHISNNNNDHNNNNNNYNNSFVCCFFYI